MRTLPALSRALVVIVTLSGLQAVEAAQEPGKTASQNITFIKNDGQLVDSKGRLRPDLLYTADAGGARLYFQRDRVSIVFTRASVAAHPAQAGMPHGETDEELRTYRMDLRFDAANPSPLVRAEDPAPGLRNYYAAHCPAGVLGVKQYRTIRYENLWRGIDAVFMERDGRLKYEFVVSPGANPSDIRLRYEGADAVALTAAGGLEVLSPLGRIHEDAPVSWLLGTDGGRVPVASAFRLEGDALGFRVASHDATATLIIDPWATYFGGTGSERGAAVAVDAQGNILLAGASNGADFPVNNAQQAVNGGSYDATVTKFTAGGTMIWSTYYGGSAIENGYAIAVDGSGNVALAGRTYSANFPTQNAQQSSMGGTGDAYVVKFNDAGVRLWATFLGGSGGEEGFGVGMDGSGNVYTCGRTYSADFPTLNAFQSAQASGSADVFVSRFSASGVLQWSTYYGGTSDDYGWGLTLDGSANVIVAGQTKSSSFPVAGGFQGSFGGGNGDGFVVKFNSNGGREWASFYGGSDFDEFNRVAVDGSGNIALVGMTRSANFPVANAQQNTLAGSSDATVVYMSSTGTRMWATYCGGPGSNDEDYGTGVVFDANGNVVITAGTTSTGFPVLNPQQASNAGATDAALVKYNASGTRQWGTYYGGSADEYAGSPAITTGNTIVVPGYTYSTDLYVPGASQAANAGNADAFIATFLSTGSLPVEFVAFTGELRDGRVELHFRTEAEKNNAGFEIQRRAETVDAAWQNIGTVPARALRGDGAEYTFSDVLTDQEMTAAFLAYRVKQIDVDGSYSYSPELHIRMETTAAVSRLGLYPSPARDNVTVTWNGLREISDIQILNMLGHVVLSSSSTASRANGAALLHVGSLPGGLYLVRVGEGAPVPLRIVR